MAIVSRTPSRNHRKKKPASRPGQADPARFRSDGQADEPAGPTRTADVYARYAEGHLSTKHLAELRKSGLTDRTICENELRTETDQHVLARLFNRAVEAKLCRGGLLFPYLDLHGKATGYARLKPNYP